MLQVKNESNFTINVPCKVKKYRIINLINSGSYSVVFKVKNEKDEDFAMKVISRKQIEQCQIVMMIEQELRILDSYSKFCPNLMHMERVITDNENIYIILEYCKSDLYLEMCNNINPSPISPNYYQADGLCNNARKNQIMKVFMDILNGVKYLHNHGIAHRDLKLENIFIKEDGVAKIGDFGCSATTQDLRQFKVGTVAYMPPEAFMNRYIYDFKKADIWSLGVLLFILATGKYPFTLNGSNDPKECEDPKKIMNAEIIWPFFLVDKKIRKIITMCLKRDPNERPTAQELIDFIESDQSDKPLIKLRHFHLSSSLYVPDCNKKKLTLKKITISPHISLRKINRVAL